LGVLVLGDRFADQRASFASIVGISPLDQRPTSNSQRPIMNERHCREQEQASLYFIPMGLHPWLHYVAPM